GWTFSVSDKAVEFLATGQTLTQTYTVIVTDINGASSTQLVTITITGTNDAPVITVGAGDSAGTGLTETNAGLTTNGTLTVTDADLSDTVTPTVPLVTLSGVTGGLTSADVLGMIQVSPVAIAANPGDTHNLNWSFNSGSQAFNFLAANETLTLTYTVKDDDSHPGGTATQAVTIIITGTDDPPVITVGAGDSAGTGLTETNPVLTTTRPFPVTCSSLSAPVTLTLPLVPLFFFSGGLARPDLLSFPTRRSSDLAANPGDTHNLNWSFNSGSQAFNFLAANETLTLTYTVKVDDGHPGGTATQAVTIIIGGTDNAPAITVGARHSAGTGLTHTNAR